MIMLCTFGLLGCAYTTGKGGQPMDTASTVAIVNKYLNIMLVENNHGKGLETILSEDFVFDDPFGKASSAREFIRNTQRWIDTRKSFRMQQQFIDGTHVFSLYTIDVVTPSGTQTSAEVVDLVELRAGRIAREKVYFANPVKFAKDMGFVSEYLKQFQ
jgi:ketosteroid isomerase-like protein